MKKREPPPPPDTETHNPENTQNNSSPSSSSTRVNSPHSQRQLQGTFNINTIKQMSQAVDKGEHAFCAKTLIRTLECINETDGVRGLLSALPMVASICERSASEQNSFLHCSLTMQLVLTELNLETLKACFNAIRAINQDKDAQHTFSRTYDYAQCYLLLLDGLFSCPINNSTSAMEQLLGDDFLTELSDVMHAKLVASREDTHHIVNYLARSADTSREMPVEVVNIVDQKLNKDSTIEWARKGIDSILDNIINDYYSDRFIKAIFLGEHGDKLEDKSKGFIAISAFYPSVFYEIVEFYSDRQGQSSTNSPVMDQYFSKHEARIDTFLEVCFKNRFSDGLAHFSRFAAAHNYYFTNTPYDLYPRFRKAVVMLYRQYEKCNPQKACFLCAGALSSYYNNRGFFTYKSIPKSDKTTNLALTEIYLDNLSGIYDYFRTQGSQTEKENSEQFSTFFVDFFRSSVTHALPKMKEEKSAHMTHALHTFLTDISKKDPVTYLNCLNHSFSILSSGLSVHAKKPGAAFRFVCENYINGLASVVNNTQLTVDNGALVLIENCSQQSNNQGNEQARIQYLNTRLKRTLKPVYEINTKVDLDVLMSNMEYLKSYIEKHCLPLLPGFLAIEMGVESGNTGKYDLYGGRIDEKDRTSTRNDQLQNSLPHNLTKHTPRKLLEKMELCQEYAETAGEEAALSVWAAILRTYLHGEYGGPFQHHFRYNAFLGNPGLPNPGLPKKENTQEEKSNETTEKNTGLPTQTLAPELLEMIPKHPKYGAVLLMTLSPDIRSAIIPQLSCNVLSYDVMKALFKWVITADSKRFHGTVSDVFQIFHHLPEQLSPITESWIDRVMKQHNSVHQYIVFLQAGYLSYTDKLSGTPCYGWQSVSKLWQASDKNKQQLMKLFKYYRDDGTYDWNGSSPPGFESLTRICQAARSLAQYSEHHLPNKSDILICFRSALNTFKKRANTCIRDRGKKWETGTKKIKECQNKLSSNPHDEEKEKIKAIEDTLKIVETAICSETSLKNQQLSLFSQPNPTDNSNHTQQPPRSPNTNLPTTSSFDITSHSLSDSCC